MLVLVLVLDGVVASGGGGGGGGGGGDGGSGGCGREGSGDERKCVFSWRRSGDGFADWREGREW